MSQMEFDPEDTAILAVVAFAAAVMAGLGSFSVFDVSLSDTVSLSGMNFSYAYLATAAGFAWTVVTNDMDVADIRDRAESELDDYYYYALVGSFAMLLAWPFVDAIPSFIQSGDLWGVLFIAASVGAQVSIGYLR